MERSNIVIMTEDDDIIMQDNKRIFSTGATKNVSKGKGRYDLIPCEALEALAKRFEFGVEQGHEENGYRKGIPDNVLFDSAMRHLNQARAGLKGEDHLAAVMWNVSVLIYNRDTKNYMPLECQSLREIKYEQCELDEHLSSLYGKGEIENDENN